MNPLDAWLDDLRTELGVLDDPVLDPSGSLDVAALLDLTRVVAHGVLRPAAPLTLFVLGVLAGRTDASREELAALVARVEALVATHEPSPSDS